MSTPAAATSKSRAEKLKSFAHMNSWIIEHPRMRHTLKRIDDCREMSSGAREPHCMLILGNTGVGKTTIRDHYVSKHPRQETETGTVVPVLSVTVPIPAKIPTLASTFLAALGDPMPEKGQTDEKTRRLRQLIKECGVELIFIDEFHHFIDRESDKILKTVSDWLKNLISEARVPVILTGLPHSKQVIETNDQLQRRFSRQITLQPFALGSRSNEFKKLLNHVQANLDIESEVKFSDPENSRRFFYATGGYIAWVMKIARGAAFRAIDRGHKAITMELLAEAYEEQLLASEDTNFLRINKGNPFHEDWEPPKIQNFSAPTKLAQKAHAPSTKLKKSDVRSDLNGLFSAR